MQYFPTNFLTLSKESKISPNLSEIIANYILCKIVYKNYKFKLETFINLK